MINPGLIFGELCRIETYNTEIFTYKEKIYVEGH